MAAFQGGPSHYAILGLDRDFTPQQLKKRYRALAMRWHPDRNRGQEALATEQFKHVQAAFEVLADATLRRAYDAELAMSRARGACAQTPRGRGATDPSGAAARPPPRPPPPRPKDDRTAKQMAEAMRSDEFAQRVRKAQAAAAEAEEKAEREAAARAADGDEDGDDDELDDEEQIAEALRAVEEAMQREQEEFEAALRAIEAAEMSPRGNQSEVAVTAERQLEALMELGFHAEVALPLCDGVSSIEDLVETLVNQTM